MNGDLTRRPRLLALPLALATLLLAAACSSPAGGQSQAQQPSAPSAAGTAAPTTGHKDIDVELEGRMVTLVSGAAETEAAPGSASKIVTRYFGNEATGDLNADGAQDIAFLITRSGGGSGTFYYAVVALRTTSGYAGTNAFLLGDRIAPQTTQIVGNELIVNYAERKSGEPMTTSPSVGVTKYLKVVGGKLQLAR